MTPTLPWTIVRRSGTAAELHADLEPPEGPTLVVNEPVRPALVLGSTQDDSGVDHGALAAADTDLVRRRSGGGAVLVGATEVTWIDFLVPDSHRWWSPDVGRAAHPVGHLWAAVLRRFDIVGRVCEGPPVNTEWSPAVCFAGLGHGEVTVDGFKVVGVSQRRSRGVARLQTMLLRRWQPERLVKFLGLDHDPLVRGALDESARGCALDHHAVIDVVLDEVARI